MWPPVLLSVLDSNADVVAQPGLVALSATSSRIQPTWTVLLPDSRHLACMLAIRMCRAGCKLAEALHRLALAIRLEPSWMATPSSRLGHTRAMSFLFGAHVYSGVSAETTAPLAGTGHGWLPRGLNPSAGVDPHGTGRQWLCPRVGPAACFSHTGKHAVSGGFVHTLPSFRPGSCTTELTEFSKRCIREAMDAWWAKWAQLELITHTSRRTSHVPRMKRTLGTFEEQPVPGNLVEVLLSMWSVVA